MDTPLKYALVIFDLDGTLAPFDSDQLYPDAAEWIENHQWMLWMIATNQGGIGLRYWMEKDGFGNPEKYPTLEQFQQRLNTLFPWLRPDTQKGIVLLCAAYQSKKTGQWGPVPEWGKAYAMWNPDWRKPAPGMLEHARIISGFIPPEATLMVGDSEEDRLAAESDGCSFQWAWEFFGREKPAENKDH